MRRFTWLPAAALLLAGCADRSPVDTTPAEPAPVPTSVRRLDCVASPAARTLACGEAGDGLFRRNIIGGQGEYIRIASTNVSFDGGTGTFQADLTVQNLLPYPIGTRDGTTVDSGGVKVFFNSGPVTTGGTGAVTVQNADGVGTFTATNQPFFKYAQRLVTNQISTPRTWQFHLDPGVTNFAFTLLVETKVPSSAFRVITPQPNEQVNADSLLVTVSAAPPPGVNFIRAAVSGRSIFLAYADSGLWRGKINLVGLGAGTLSLRVAAIAPADSTVELVPFVYGIAPNLQLALPLENSVARPTLRVMGTCVDNTSCTVTGVIGATTLFSTPGAAFDVSPSLAAFDGSQRVLTVRGTDTDGNVTAINRTVFVESTPHWTELMSAWRILAVSDTRVLYVDSLAGGNQIRVRTIASGADSLVMQRPVGSVPNRTYLLPNAVLVTFPNTSVISADSIQEFRNGALSYLGSGRDIHAKGDWFTWTLSAVYLRNEATGTTGTVPLPANIMDLGPNGDVVYGQEGDVWRYRAGVSTQITTGGATEAKTDGNLIVFRYHSSQIGLYDGTGVTVLSGQAFGWFVNNGWVAFTTYDTHATVQAFSRAPDGTIRQASDVPNRGLPEGIGATGEVIFYDNAGRRFLSAPPYTSRVDVGHAWGASAPIEFFGSTAYTHLGRSAFRITP